MEGLGVRGTSADVVDAGVYEAKMAVTFLVSQGDDSRPKRSTGTCATRRLGGDVASKGDDFGQIRGARGCRYVGHASHGSDASDAVLVAGSGRNVAKTTTRCFVTIELFCSRSPSCIPRCFTEILASQTIGAEARTTDGEHEWIRGGQIHLLDRRESPRRTRLADGTEVA